MAPSKVVISKRLVAINSASFALVRLLGASVFLWARYRLLHVVSPEEFSVFVVIGGFFFLMPVLLQVFFGSTLRYVINHYARDEMDQVTSIVSSIFPILIVVGGLICVATALGVRYIEVLFVIPAGCKLDAQLMLMLISLWAVLNLVLSPFTLGIHVLQKYVFNNTISLVGEVLKIILLFVLLFGVSTRALWVAVATTAGELFCLFVRVVVSVRLVPQLRLSRSHIEPALVPKLIWLGVWNSLVVLSRYLQNHGSLIIMNRFSTPVEVNCFSLGRSMNREANQFWEPARASLGPPLTAMYATGSWGRLRKAYCTGGRYAIWIVMAVVIPLVVFRHEFVRLYAGQQYLKAAPVLLFWLLPIPFQLVNVMLPQIARAQARLKGLALRTVCVRLVSLLAIVVVVHYYKGDSLSAAIVFAGCSIVGEIALIWPHGCRLLDVRMGRVLREVIGPGLAPAGVALAVLLLVRSVYHPHTWLQLAAAATVGGLAYLGGVLLALKADDRQGLLALVKRGVVKA